MGFTTAAIIGSAALGAGGSILSSNAQKKAASQAANASQRATDASIAEQRRQFDIAQQQMQPWLTTGNSALNQLAGIYGLNTTPGAASANSYAYLQANPDAKAAIDAGYFGGPGNYDAAVNWHRNQYGGHQANAGNVAAAGYATPQGGNATTGQVSATQVGMNGNPIAVPAGSAGGQSLPVSNAMSAFFASPDYQFRMNEAMRTANARNAALGIQDSGAAYRDAIQYSGNLASGEFNNYANRLASLAGVGQTAANTLGNQGQAMAGNIGNALMNNASNLSSSYAQQGQANAGMWGSLAGIGSGLFGQFGGR